MVGRTCAVLFEQPEGRDFTGHAENYVKVYVEAEALHNQVLPVEIVSVEADGSADGWCKKIFHFLKKTVDKTAPCRYNHSCPVDDGHMAA